MLLVCVTMKHNVSGRDSDCEKEGYDNGGDSEGTIEGLCLWCLCLWFCGVCGRKKKGVACIAAIKY